MNLLLATLSLSAITNVITQSVDVRLAAADANRSLSRFVDYRQNAATDRFVINPDFWGKNIDLSCASPWNSMSGNFRAGTLVSPRHIIFAKHYPLDDGTRLVFVDNEGVVCPVYLKASKSIPGADICVGLLESEVTPTIRPACILPQDYEKYIGCGEHLPVVTLTQNEEAVITDLSPIPTNRNAKILISLTASTKDRLKFRKKLIGGDSGNPAFLICNDQPILIYCLTTGRSGTGAAIHRYAAEIQKAMDDLCPGYKIKAFDFSALAGGCGSR